MQCVTTFYLFTKINDIYGIQCIHWLYPMSLCILYIYTMYIQAYRYSLKTRECFMGVSSTINYGVSLIYFSIFVIRVVQMINIGTQCMWGTRTQWQ